ncbi:unnamed protein product [Cladocopium goreaui]|uniref:YdhG-like domain-containing protein n=1 Tax=Cladocopium goreaui TaxID=2562237 RepID=A0A9P1CUH1_9DINO|nr:unnamed protein product [Cladocopium goreaui]
MPKMTEINKSMTVAGLISSIQPPEKQNDVKKILQVLKKYSKDIHVWGDNIIGAGKMLYQSKSQKPYTWFQCGVAPRASNISVYLGMTPLSSATVAKVGPKCSHGVGCLYIKSLADVNMKELEALLKKCFAVKEFVAPGAKPAKPSKPLKPEGKGAMKVKKRPGKKA